MVAEGIHSIVDTVNELFLLLGISRSKKQPDATHPFGYGKELYFWSFIVSIMIFGLGGGISIYQGITHIIKPGELRNVGINYLVLALSVLFEGTSLIIALKQFNKLRGGTSFWEAIVKSKDPSSFLVLFEDSAAVAGLFVVAVCLFLNQHFHIAALDGVASVIVGLILVATSSILARESRSLLMGEGISDENKEVIITLLEGDADIVKVVHILSAYQSPTEVLLTVIVTFKDDLDTRQINDAIIRLRFVIKDKFKVIRYILFQPEIAEHQDFWSSR